MREYSGRLLEHAFRHVKNNTAKTAPAQVGLGLLVFILLSRFSITYLNSYGVIGWPEQFLQARTLGNDLLFGILNPAYDMLGGKPFDMKVGYGHGASSIAAAAITVLGRFRVCDVGDRNSCVNTLYRLYVVMTVSGYLLFVGRILKKERMAGTLILFAFLLSVPGALGMDRGNIDLLFSLLWGFMLSYAMSQLHQRVKPVVPSVMAGIAAAIMANTKIVLVILSVFLIMIVPNAAVSGSAFLIYTLILPPATGFFYHVPARLTDPLIAAMKLQSSYSHAVSKGWIPNMISAETLIRRVTGSRLPAHSISLFIPALFIVGAVTCLPVLLYLRKHSLIRHTSFAGYVMAILRTQPNAILIIGYMTATVLVFLPAFSQPYRLYYFLPLILLFADRVTPAARPLFYTGLLLFTLGISWFTELIHIVFIYDVNRILVIIPLLAHIPFIIL